MGRSIADKIADAVYEKVDPIVKGWEGAAKKYRDYAYIILLFVCILTALLSIFTPWKFFPKHISIEAQRQNTLSRALGHISLHKEVQSARSGSALSSYKKGHTNSFGFPDEWRVRPPQLK